MAATVPVVSYQELQSALAGLESAVSAAEAHGCLCGALCAREGFSVAEWLGELVAADAAPGSDAGAGAALGALHLETLEALRSQDFGFEPLLPDPESALAERVQALAEWCGGFLYGLGAGAGGVRLSTQGDLDEILEDLSEITRARIDPQESDEAGEAAFTELHEFVRTGAQLAFDELAATRAARPFAGAAVH